MSYDLAEGFELIIIFLFLGFVRQVVCCVHDPGCGSMSQGRSMTRGHKKVGRGMVRASLAIVDRSLARFSCASPPCVSRLQAAAAFLCKKKIIMIVLAPCRVVAGSSCLH